MIISNTTLVVVHITFMLQFPLNKVKEGDDIVIMSHPRAKKKPVLSLMQNVGRTHLTLAKGFSPLCVRGRMVALCKMPAALLTREGLLPPRLCLVKEPLCANRRPHS
jgi:hypothetical protein